MVIFPLLSNVYVVKPLLGKSFDAYEKVIGKAKLRTEGKGDNLSESRFYKVPGFVRVILTRPSPYNGVKIGAT